MAELALSELKRSKTDPFQSVALLQTGQSAKSRFCELEDYKAAICTSTHRPLLPQTNHFGMTAIRLIAANDFPPKPNGLFDSLIVLLEMAWVDISMAESRSNVVRLLDEFPGFW